jgi:hypothetical protein
MPRPRSLYPYHGPDISILPNHRTFLICLDSLYRCIPVLGLGSGHFQALHRPEAGGIGLLESTEGPGRWCSGGQTEMGEDLAHHGGMLDGGDDLQGATALEATPIPPQQTTLLSRRLPP